MSAASGRMQVGPWDLLASLYALELDCTATNLPTKTPPSGSNKQHCVTAVPSTLPLLN